MELDKALSQISEIHAHLLKSEVFRGYRSGPVALTGLVALAASVIQTRVLAQQDVAGFVLCWVVVAGLCATICGLDLALNRSRRSREDLRQRSLAVLSQFFPAIAVGALLTAFLASAGTPLPSLLPALWVLLFGIGVFSSWPYLPRAIGWVGAWYLCTGAVLLATRDPLAVPAAWPLGCIFGIGQLAAAVILHVSLERKPVGV